MVPHIHLALGPNKAILTQLQAIWFTVEHRVNAVPSATLTLSTTGNALLLSQAEADIALCKNGNKISISLQEDDSSQKAVVFSGVIVEQELQMTRTSATLTLKLCHSLACLESTYRSKVHANLSAAQILKNIFQQHQVPLSNLVKMNIQQEQLIQFRCSDWLFTRRLLDEKGAWLLPSPDGVQVVSPKLAAKADLTLRNNDLNSQSSSVSLYEARWLFNDQHQTKKLTFTGWDIQTQKIMSVNATSEKLGDGALDPQQQRPLSNLPWVKGSSASLTPEELGALANSTLQHLLAGAIQGVFRVQGSTTYQLGQTLALSGFGKHYDGAGIITSIAHNIDKALWTTELTVGLAGLTSVITPLPAIGGLHVGVVEPFKEDPQNLERLRVKLPVLGDKDNVVWARLALPYASKGSGFTFYPESGDEVVIDFFDDDPAFPVIIGSMYNPKNKAPVALSKANKEKGITLKVSDKKSLALKFNTDELSTELINDADTLTMKKGVVIEGSSKIELKSKKIDLGN